MDETLTKEITQKVQDNQKASVRECPYCHGKRIESMGFRDVSNKVKRFRCKNPECLKSHSRDAETMELCIVIPEPQDESANLTKNQRANKHINVTQGTLERVRLCKIYERETDDDLINRLIDIHYGKVK